MGTPPTKPVEEEFKKTDEAAADATETATEAPATEATAEAPESVEKLSEAKAPEVAGPPPTDPTVAEN